MYVTQPAVRLLRRIKGVDAKDVARTLGKGSRSRISAKDVRQAMLLQGRVGDAVMGLQFSAQPHNRRHN